MILFCDTSALLKLYVREDGSDDMAAQARRSDVLAVCRLAYVEAASAFARRVREQPRDAAALALARERLDAGWPHYFKLDVTQELVELAADYADSFALRAYDSLQLAALQTVNRQQPGETVFACFDARLVKAARVLGIASI